MPTTSLLPLASMALIISLPFSNSAAASDFYRGKTISLVINYSAAGPTDAEGRLIAKHLSKHITGHPVFLVRNMPGGTGIIALNWMGEIAPSDGLSVGFFSGIASQAALGNPGIRVDLSKFNIIATAGSTSISFVRADTGPGIRRPEDLMKVKELWLGGMTPDANKDLKTRMQLDLLGITYKYVTGYGGAAEVRLALERGEVQISSETMPSYNNSIAPALVRPGTAIPVWHEPADDGETMSRSPETEHIPALTYPDYFAKVKGHVPSGDVWDSLRSLTQLSSVLRLIVMPPGTPGEAAGEIRAAIVKISSDSEFWEDAMKALSFVPSYAVGPKMERLFAEKVVYNAKLSTFIKSYINSVETRP